MGRRNMIGQNRAQEAPKARVAKADRITTALELAREGKTTRQIGVALGVSHVTAAQYLKDGYVQLPMEAASQYRETVTARYEMLWEQVTDQIERKKRTVWVESDDDPEVLVPMEIVDDVDKIVSSGTRVLEGLRKLHGLDAPMQIESVVVNYVIEGVDMTNLR